MQNNDEPQPPEIDIDSDMPEVTKTDEELEEDVEAAVTKDIDGVEIEKKEAENNLMYGLTYDEYKQNYKNKGNLQQCGYCTKFFENKKNGFITKDMEGELVCYHCLFWINYSVDTRPTVDGVYDRTIHDYILECEPTHDVEKCTRPGECFICDYKSGIKIEGILGGDELYEKWKSENEEPTDGIDFKFVIKI